MQSRSDMDDCTRFMIQCASFKPELQGLAAKFLFIGYGWLVAYIYDCLYYDVGELT